MARKTAKRRQKRRSTRSTIKAHKTLPGECPRCASTVERLAQMFNFDADEARAKLGIQSHTCKPSQIKTTGKPEGTKKKRKLSPYIRFSQKERSSVVAANAGMAPKNVMKELGKRWRKLSDSEKKGYA